MKGTSQRKDYLKQKNYCLALNYKTYNNYDFQAGEDLLQDKPETREQIEPILASLNEQWEELERTTKAKGEKLFDSNRSVLYEQSCDDIDGWMDQLESQIVTEEAAKDLTTVNLLMQKQNVSLWSVCSQVSLNPH